MNPHQYQDAVVSSMLSKRREVKLRLSLTILAIIWVLMLLQVFDGALHYGERWECGRYYLPRSLLSDDGKTYADGSEVNLIQAALIHSGWEEESELFLGIGLIVSHTFFFSTCIRFHRWKRRYALTLLELDYLDWLEQLRAGDRGAPNTSDEIVRLKQTRWF